MRASLLAPVLALVSLPVLAQPPASAPADQPTGAPTEETSLATPAGHELNFSLGSYKYTEPGDISISIHGAKFGAEYIATLPLDGRTHWFARADVRGTTGNTAYDGWCFPFLITPNGSSPNGWELGLGDPSPCNYTGDKDWYVETRGVVGKDFFGGKWAWSPYGGLGFRHLSNGTTGVPGFRTDDYLYLPVGVTARTRVAARSTLAFTLEYDQLLHGWQTTRDSALGGGDVPATPTAPPFTINGFSDISFDQHGGWALRASAKWQLKRRWSVEPFYIHWKVNASPVSYETVTFTVNNIPAQEQWGAYEPLNRTNEFGVKFGLHF